VGQAPEAEEEAALADPWGGEAEHAIVGPDGSGDGDVDRLDLDMGELFDSNRHHLDVRQVELALHLTQEARAATTRLDEQGPPLGSDDRERQARQSGTAAEVRDGGCRGAWPGADERVQ